MNSRQIDYFVLSPIAFAKKYRHGLFQLTQIEYQDGKHEIQMNFCTNPYCSWFGLPQKRFETVKNKPFRYKLIGSNNDGKAVECNPDPENLNGTAGGCFITPVFNWSVADEIARLARNDAVRDVEPACEFHRKDCKQIGKTPFDAPYAYYRRGTSSGKSQKWQCKVCKKITNVLPWQPETFSYHQQRNDVLPQFARLLVNRTPVKRPARSLASVRRPTTQSSSGCIVGA